MKLEDLMMNNEDYFKPIIGAPYILPLFSCIGFIHSSRVKWPYTILSFHIHINYYSL